MFQSKRTGDMFHRLFSDTFTFFYSHVSRLSTFSFRHGFPADTIHDPSLRHFHCITCALSELTVHLTGLWALPV